MAYQIAISSLLCFIGLFVFGLAHVHRANDVERKRLRLRKRMNYVVSCNERNRETDDFPSSLLAFKRTRDAVTTDRKSISQYMKKTIVNYLNRTREYTRVTMTKFKAKVLGRVNRETQVKMLIRTTFDERGDSEDHVTTNKSK